MENTPISDTAMHTNAMKDRLFSESLASTFMELLIGTGGRGSRRSPTVFDHGQL
jgi:hypothetical protein